jgi:hypothetical protein
LDTFAPMKLLLATLLAASVLTGCGWDTTSCANSEPLADGASEKVTVEVATKPGLGTNIIGQLDVDEGFYSAPVKENGAETNVAVGKYTGTVTKSGSRLTLRFADQALPLSGPQDCD